VREERKGFIERPRSDKPGARMKGWGGIPGKEKARQLIEVPVEEQEHQYSRK
jgi:hypothetical protein